MKVDNMRAILNFVSNVCVVFKRKSEKTASEDLCYLLVKAQFLKTKFLVALSS